MIALIGVVAWLCVAVPLALLIGAAIRIADRQIDTALSDYRVEDRDDLTALVQPESWSQADRDRQAIERSWIA